MDIPETLATTKGKDFALAALKKRRENPPVKIDNSRLPAGSPIYFYCISCDHLSAELPESYTGHPKKLCPECEALKELGWLE